MHELFETVHATAQLSHDVTEHILKGIEQHDYYTPSAFESKEKYQSWLNKQKQEMQNRLTLLEKQLKQRDRPAVTSQNPKKSKGFFSFL